MVSWILESFCLMMMLAAPVYPDDEITPVVTGIEHPLPVFSEPMQKAANVIADAFGRLDHMLFMSDDYWPVPLNNTTLNLSA